MNDYENVTFIPLGEIFVKVFIFYANHRMQSWLLDFGSARSNFDDFPILT